MAKDYITRFKITGIANNPEHEAARSTLIAVLATNSVDGSDVAAA